MYRIIFVIIFTCRAGIVTKKRFCFSSLLIGLEAKHVPFCAPLFRVSCTFFLFFLFFFPSYLLSSRFCSLFLLVVTQIRGHMTGSSPLPTTVRALHFYREKISALASLVDSRRIVLTHARRSQQLILFFIFANKLKISPRRDSNSRTNTSSIRGLPLVHRGERLDWYTLIQINGWKKNIRRIFIND